MTKHAITSETKNNVNNAVRKQGYKCKKSKQHVCYQQIDEYLGINYWGFGSEPNELYYNGQYLYF